jgi:hypothetical protein
VRTNKNLRVCEVRQNSEQVFAIIGKGEVTILGTLTIQDLKVVTPSL